MARNNTPVDVFKKINMHEGDTNVCWEWQGTLNAKDGRPYFTIAGKRRPAYVIVLEAFTGEEANGRVARHDCDHEYCCNPHHLQWGTNQDNSNDMVDRERHGMPKTVLRAIRKLISKGKTQQEIATLYGISRETVSSIATGRSHLDKE